MAEIKKNNYMELQMEELKVAQEDNAEKELPKKVNPKRNPKNAQIAEMYEDAAEYEADLACFEKELEIVNANQLGDIASALNTELPDEERDYAKELDSVLETGWMHLVEVAQTHPKEQLELIKSTEFAEVVNELSKKYPEYEGDFEKDVRDILAKRWENLIDIKKEHIKQEIAEIKTSGLKPKYVKRIYEQYHGLK